MQTECIVAFPLQQCLGERATPLRHTYISCLVTMVVIGYVHRMASGHSQRQLLMTVDTSRYILPPTANPCTLQIPYQQLLTNWHHSRCWSQKLCVL